MKQIDGKNPSGKFDEKNYSFKNVILLGALFIAAAMMLWVVKSAIPTLFSSAANSPSVNHSVTVKITFSPTVYKDRNIEHGDLAVIYDKESMEREVTRLQDQLQRALTKSLEDSLKGTFESIEKRVDDTWSSVQGIGLISGLIGVLMTLLVLYFSFSSLEDIKEARADLDKRVGDLSNAQTVLLSKAETDLDKRIQDLSNAQAKLLTNAKTDLDKRIQDLSNDKAELDKRMSMLSDRQDQIVRRIKGEYRELQTDIKVQLDKRLALAMDQITTAGNTVTKGILQVAGSDSGVHYKEFGTADQNMLAGKLAGLLGGKSTEKGFNLIIGGKELADKSFVNPDEIKVINFGRKVYSHFIDDGPASGWCLANKGIKISGEGESSVVEMRYIKSIQSI